ncbi:MAG: type II methionyl aminopeptidase [Promethearchaeota archaeon]
MAKKTTTSKKTTTKKASTSKSTKAKSTKKVTKSTSKPTKKTTSKTTTKKTAAKKPTTTKKATTKKTTAKKPTTTKKPATKTTSKPTTSKKTVSKKTSAKPVKKTTTPKKSTKKTTKKPAKPKKTEEEIQEEKERLESYKKAGAIAKKVKTFIRPKIKPGIKLIDLVDLAEKKIVELGGKTGFPVNISINHVAAHYTPPPGDTTEIQDGDIIKFDLGVHIEGYSVDTAFTVSLNTEPALENLVKASEEAVENAIKLVKHGVKTNTLGEIIEKTVRKYGYKPVHNLQGHKIERWDVHGGKSIPCVSTPTGDTMEDGEIFAVEVFVSNGEGAIHAQSSNEQIYQLNPRVGKIPLRNKTARRILGYLVREFKTLPFSRYQVYQEFPQGTFALFSLVNTNKLEKHHILAEKKGFFIAQTEHTILVTKTGCKILT